MVGIMGDGGHGIGEYKRELGGSGEYARLRRADEYMMIQVRGESMSYQCDGGGERLREQRLRNLYLYSEPCDREQWPTSRVAFVVRI